VLNPLYYLAGVKNETNVNITIFYAVLFHVLLGPSCKASSVLKPEVIAELEWPLDQSQ